MLDKVGNIVRTWSWPLPLQKGARKAFSKVEHSKNKEQGPEDKENVVSYSEAQAGGGVQGEGQWWTEYVDERDWED